MREETVVNSLPTLKKRVGRFLNSNCHSRDEVVSVIQEISSLGDVAIFGGMLRDFSLSSIREFDSDVDLVIATKDEQALEEKIKVFNFKKNSFGGYRIQLKKWQVDLWPLHKTWAFREGYVKSNDKFEDLLATTFFNWDAVVYDINGGRIISSDDYLESLRKRILDFNLQENPNTTGATIRILRALLKHNAKLTPRLTDYLYMQLKDKSAEEICRSERNGYSERYLNRLRIDEILCLLRQHKISHPESFFEFPSAKQLSFFCDN